MTSRLIKAKVLRAIIKTETGRVIRECINPNDDSEEILRGFYLNILGDECRERWLFERGAGTKIVFCSTDIRYILND